MIQKCPTCGETYWKSDGHKCPPEWKVSCKFLKIEGVVYADDAQQAAEKYAKKKDRENKLANGEALFVVEDEKGNKLRFMVIGEIVTEYYARFVNC